MKFFISILLLSALVFFQVRISVTDKVYPDKIHSLQSSIVSDMVCVSLGFRKLCANIAFIRLLQYYGTPEADTLRIDTSKFKNKKITKEHIEMSEYYVYSMAPKVFSSMQGGKYFEIADRTKHILSLDPYFESAVLFSAGVLAFNLSRPDEALEILLLAKKYIPDNKQYNLYIGAIGHSKTGNTQKAAEILHEAIQYPNTPAMVKNITAFLYKRLKNYRRAYEIYLDIYNTSKDEQYRQRAKKQLKLLEKMI